MTDIYEIIFRVDQGALDGKPVGIAPLGLRFTPTQWESYLVDDTDTPAGFAPRTHFDQKRLISRMRANVIEARAILVDLTKTIETFRTEVYGGGHTAEEEAAQIEDLTEWLNDALTQDLSIQTDGYDTNWRAGDLRAFGSVLVDLALNEVAHFQYPKPKAQHPILPYETDAPRNERIIYTSFANPAQIGRWRDGSDYETVGRSVGDQSNALVYSDGTWHEVL